MSSMLYTLILAIISFAQIDADLTPAKRQTFLEIGQFDQVEGKDAANYTFISQYSQDLSSTLGSTTSLNQDKLIACAANGQRVVNSLKILAQSTYPAGANYETDTIYLALTGNLAGKFVFIKETGLLTSYLKKTSSVLGSSYVSTRSHSLLVADRLDLNALINPQGAFEQFKKASLTVGQGKSVTL